MSRKALANLVILVPILALAACASTSSLQQTETGDYRERAATRGDDDVRVSVSVLSAAESREVYGVDLADKDIQPVWIQVTNTGNASFWLISTGLDPNFFPPSEAADAFAGGPRDNDQVGQGAVYTQQRVR